MVREVRSPWNTTGNEPMRGYSPGSRSSPSNAPRSDGGHIAGHVGKGASQPASVRDGFVPSATPVVGGQRNVIEE
jgi:hypothetical protein